MPNKEAEIAARVCSNIRHGCISKGIPIGEMEKACGRSQGYFSKKGNISLACAVTAAELLGTSVDDLIRKSAYEVSPIVLAVGQTWTNGTRKTLILCVDREHVVHRPTNQKEPQILRIDKFKKAYPWLAANK